MPNHFFAGHKQLAWPTIRIVNLRKLINKKIEFKQKLAGSGTVA